MRPIKNYSKHKWKNKMYMSRKSEEQNNPKIRLQISFSVKHH